MSAQLSSAVLHVTDVARSVRFYGEAFGLGLRFVDDLGVYAELETGATALALSERAFAERHTGPTRSLPADGPALPSEIALAVADVPAAVERAVAAGARLVFAPEMKYWGQVVAYLRDPDGHLLQICTPLAL